MLGLLNGNSDKFITPNLGSLYNRAGGVFVNPELAGSYTIIVNLMMYWIEKEVEHEPQNFLFKIC